MGFFFWSAEGCFRGVSSMSGAASVRGAEPVFKGDPMPSLTSIVPQYLSRGSCR